MLTLNFIVLILSQQFLLVPAEDILILTAGSPKSHFMFLSPFLDTLIQRGHSVTVVTPIFPLNPENFTVHLFKEIPDFSTVFLPLVYKDYAGDPYSSMGYLEKQIGVKICLNFVRSKPIKELTRLKKKYDVAIATSLLEECTFIIGHLLARHVVFLNFMRKLLPVYGKMTGVLAPYSFVPHTAMSGFDSLSFSQRFSNAIKSIHHSEFLRDYKTCEKNVNDDLPEAMSIGNARDNLALVFSNSDPVLSEKEPSMQHIVSIGGMHCRPAKPLPEDLNKIVEDSEHGFILFSLGTHVEAQFAGPSTTRAFVEAFARINQIVIWKTTETIPGVSDNVKLLNWIPQQDLLGHRKIRLYVSQGGIFGLQEAIYHGVPVLGFPVFMDQFSNVARLETLGCGKSMNIFNVSTDELHSAILEMLSDPRYKLQMEKYSSIFKDQTETPLERAVYWTEFLAHHVDLGHLKNPMGHLNYATYFLLDALMFCITVLFVLLILSYLMILGKNNYIK